MNVAMSESTIEHRAIPKEDARDAAASSSSGLERVLRPRSIAVLGVTPTPGSVPYDIFHNLLEGRFQGPVYPVAPKKRHIAGVRAYDYILDIPDPVDMAILVFPGSVCEMAMKQCVEKGVRAAIVISAGFRETGAAGLAREQRLTAIAREGGIRMIGPNCLGVINTEPDVSLNASFATSMPTPGSIAFVSQSGALCTAVLDYAAGRGIGFSKFVSVGNKADISEVDLLRFLQDDPQTGVILLYLESLTDGRELIRVASSITRGPAAKPILAIKGGRTDAGAAAASSHTGALAASDVLTSAAFEQAGILRCRTIEDMFNTAQLLAYQPLPASDRLAIVTNAGGPGVMATDAAIDRGLKLASFSPETTAKLRKALPAAANVNNPIDVIGDAREDRYAAAMEAVLTDDAVDNVLVILTPQSMTNVVPIAEAVRQAASRRGRTKTIAAAFMGARAVAPGVAVLHEARIPQYILPEQACDALADAVRFTRAAARPTPPIPPLTVNRDAAAAILEGHAAGYLDEPDALRVLAAYGFTVPPWSFATSADEAVDAAECIGYPVVLRLVSRSVMHKTEVGGVRINLTSRDAVRAAFTAMQRDVNARFSDAVMSGAVVRRMIPAGREVLLGASRDAVFGHAIAFGLGGIHVEVLRDVVFRVAPLDGDTVHSMIRSIRGLALLTGARGERPADLAAVENHLLRLSRLVTDFPRIAELDINPLIVAADGLGAAVADVRIRLSTD
jgi:acetyltransferase